VVRLSLNSNRWRVPFIAHTASKHSSRRLRSSYGIATCATPDHIGGSGSVRGASSRSAPLVLRNFPEERTRPRPSVESRAHLPRLFMRQAFADRAFYRSSLRLSLAPLCFPPDSVFFPVAILSGWPSLTYHTLSVAFWRVMLARCFVHFCSS
jgi:hypothetical protein